MKNFKDYMSLAINRQGLKSNNSLARELNINNAAMSALYNGKSLPADSTMIKLAELAGLPKEDALIDLNLWRSQKNPEVQTVWLRMSKMIKKLCLLLFFSRPADAAQSVDFVNQTGNFTTSLAATILLSSICLILYIMYTPLFFIALILCCFLFIKNLLKIKRYDFSITY